jgi:two-component system NtrC family sensor kinase
MKKLIIILLFCSVKSAVVAQPFDLQSLKLRSESASNDTLKLVLLDSLCLFYSDISLDSSIIYTDQVINLARKLEFKLNEALGMNNKSYALLNMANYQMALKIFLSALKIAEDPGSEEKLIPPKYRSLNGVSVGNTTPENYRLQVLGLIHFNMGILYENAGNIEKELFHYSRALQLGEQTGNMGLIGLTNMNLGRLYLFLNKNDSALICEKKAYDIYLRSGSIDYSGSVILNLGRVYLARGEKQKAVEYIQQAIAASMKQKYLRGVIAGNLLLADISMKENKIDSAYYYSRTALQTAEQLKVPDLLLRSYNAMAGFYEQANNRDSIVKYQRLIINIKDSLFNSKQARQFQNIDFDEAQHQQELESAKKDYRNQLQKYMLIAGLVIFLFIALILWRNNINKQKAYHQLQVQKEQTDFQKGKVEKTLEELRTTQAQLIQSEKMASLGELTAGIAHEIQNPLNFVNNFSEVNKELLVEMKDEIERGNLDELKAIAKDLIDNEEKINHHGKRADAIVKGMLQHSRSTSSVKEPTDINALAEEYLRLAYHGLRAKNKEFNATLKTDFDKSLSPEVSGRPAGPPAGQVGIGNVHIVPQDVGRVILNLLNNAFYAVNEKAKQNIPGYEPTVMISTRKSNNRPDSHRVEIKVKDNGNGIPQNILDKIFQPFFTTKPAGQGTGLGLSLSYDIIKAHGGEIKMETKEGEGSEFIIELPG